MVLYLIHVLWDQVVIPQLGQKYARLFHTRQIGFVTVEKLQQVCIFHGINRVHGQIFWRKDKLNRPLKRLVEIPHARETFN